MDIYCPICGEPWDVDSFHDAPGFSYRAARRTFFTEGCGVVFNGKPCVKAEAGPMAERAGASAALHDVLGSDLDGLASELEDMGI